MSTKWLGTALITVALIYCPDVSAVPVKKRKPYFLLLQAESQRTIPGIPGKAIKTDYYFVIVWKETKPPREFYWKDEAWQNCTIAKAHKNVKDDGSPAGYTSEEIVTGKIRNGDTLLIATGKGGKILPPDGIPASPKNTLWFKPGGSGWIFFPVKKITRKADIAMP
ncbi:MAG: hypothetical protein K0Q79_1376 [Flavipsychrobacter sp.]|jgi:hypothetical protein|nr:hypothetical protein [Flavipsychrobacter sp.]